MSTPAAPSSPTSGRSFLEVVIGALLAAAGAGVFAISWFVVRLSGTWSADTERIFRSFPPRVAEITSRVDTPLGAHEGAQSVLIALGTILFLVGIATVPKAVLNARAAALILGLVAVGVGVALYFDASGDQPGGTVLLVGAIAVIALVLTNRSSLLVPLASGCGAAVIALGLRRITAAPHEALLAAREALARQLVELNGVRGTPITLQEAESQVSADLVTVSLPWQLYALLFLGLMAFVVCVLALARWPQFQPWRAGVVSIWRSDSKRKVVLATLIALTSLTGAFAGWRASVASGEAGGADAKGLEAVTKRAEVRAQVMTDIEKEVFSLVRSGLYRRRAEELRRAAASVAGVDATRLLDEAAAFEDLAEFTLIGVDQSILRPDRTIEVDRQLDAKLMSAGFVNDLDPADEFRLADRHRVRTERMMGVTILLVCTVLFLTIAQIRGKPSAFVFLPAGLVTLVTAVTLLIFLEVQ